MTPPDVTYFWKKKSFHEPEYTQKNQKDGTKSTMASNEVTSMIKAADIVRNLETFRYGVDMGYRVSELVNSYT